MKVLTFSRKFPAYHPKAGQPTFFIEKLWQSFFELGLSYNTPDILSEELETFSNPSHFITAKSHTIRSGNRWKVGDKFSPRVWSGKPYVSKQITIAPDIEIKKIWTFELINVAEGITDGFINGNKMVNPMAEIISKNDGLSFSDFRHWFGKKNFEGQIICWNDKIEYL